MSDPTEYTKPKPSLSMVLTILPITGILLVVGAIFTFFTFSWVIGLCGLAIAAVVFALSVIVDLLQEIFRSLERLESKQKGDEK